jgi:uncharacterized protein (DUF433 family)
MNPNLREEVRRMSKVPWIIFSDSATGRRAEVGGCGLAVWEMVSIYKALGESWDNYRAWFDWLRDEQLKAALEYYRLYPEEIDARLKVEDDFRIEDVWEKYPFTNPNRPRN